MGISKLYRVRHGVGVGVVVAFTETRTRSQIEAVGALSVLTTITRIESTRVAVARMPEPLVEMLYTCTREAPPPALLDVLGATGVRLGAPPDAAALRSLPAPARGLPDLIEAAMAQVAVEACARLGTADALAALRDLDAAPDPRPETNRNFVGFWRHTFELLALAAAVIAPRAAVRWQLAPAAGPIASDPDWMAGPHLRAPFALVVNGAAVDLVAQVERAAATGAHGAAAAFVASWLAAAPRPAVLPRLVRRHDVVDGEVAWRALIDDEPTLPVIAYVRRDHPDTLLPPADALHAAALAGAALEEPTVEPLEVDGLAPRAIWRVHGSAWSSEKALDGTFMPALQARLGSHMLAIGTPHRGVLFACAADTGDARVDALKLLVRDAFEEADAPLSSAVWLQDGSEPLSVLDPPAD
ncbi:MAG: hypothetical protein K8W52_42665 [Deltaproteobacteria bacterium]|nr:hypothetical protein [Deltaproteobacteria bacterium]